MANSSQPINCHADVVDAIVAHMAQADPQADIQLSLVCPQCGHQWQAAFDIASFFWSEINAWANRMLREVHILASRYGWSETDILAMSPWRRQFYLEHGERMSDYLENLAAKTLKLTEVIQPRLVSLFEPPSAAGRPISGRLSAELRDGAW